MTITPSDLAVGQIIRWDDNAEHDAELIALDHDAATLRCPSCGTVTVRATDLVASINDGDSKFVTREASPAPAPIPHPSALGDLYEACVAEVKWYDETLDNYHPDDHALRALIRKTHGARIEALRSAISKAGGVA